ncbi:MAG: hypothetical protein QXX12_01235 [Nanopusillaceae archaeon]
MTRRELALGLAVLGLVLAAWFTVPWFTVPQRPAGHARVVVGAVVESYGYVIVDVGGARYVKPFNCLTVNGTQLLSSLLGFYQPWGFTDSIYFSPVKMRVYHDSGYLESAIGKSWGANSTHMWFFIQGSFSTDSALILRNVTLYAERGAVTGPLKGCCPEYHSGAPLFREVISVDTLNVNVPAGSGFTVVLAIYWYDKGALTWEWPKVLDVTLPESLLKYAAVRATDGSLYNYTHFSTAPYVYLVWGPGQRTRRPALGRASWFGTSFESPSTRLFFVCGNGTSPASRSSYRIESEVARYPAAITWTAAGLAVSTTVGFACSEVGLVMKFHPLNPNDPYYELTDGLTLYSQAVMPQRPEREVLLMRWVPEQPVQPGTVVTFYVFPARG